MRLLALMLSTGSNRWVSSNIYQKGNCFLKIREKICLELKSMCSGIIFPGLKFHLYHFLVEILIILPYLPKPQFTPLVKFE